MPRANGSANLSNLAATEVTIRRVRNGDTVELRRLAALDCRRPLAGACLLAEVDGEPWAALSLVDGEVAADPFRPTADFVLLLHERARHLQGEGRMPRTSGLRLLAAGLQLGRRSAQG